MRCHYISDLHLERQPFDVTLPRGDVLIIAGDLTQASCLDPARTDRYNLEQRARVLRFVDTALSQFAHVLLVAGNHEHFDGVLEDSAGLLRRHLAGVKVLDDEAVDIGGVRFFGATLWTDFEGRSAAAMDAVRRRMGEFFFVKTRAGQAEASPVRFQPEHALAAHDAAWSSLGRALAAPGSRPIVVVTHHAPSHQGLNPAFRGNGLDAAYASAHDDAIASMSCVPVWVHGHTHIAAGYRIGATQVLSNAYGFAGRGGATPGFSPRACFEVG